MVLSDVLRNARAIAAAALQPAAAAPGPGAGRQPQTAAPPVSFPLPQTSVSVTLNGSGNGTAQIGPSRVREHWQVDSASVSATTAVSDATCQVFVGGSANAGTFFSQTATGSSGDTCQIGTDIQPGQLIIAKWTGGDPGAIATLGITGKRSNGAPS